MIYLLASISAAYSFEWRSDKSFALHFQYATIVLALKHPSRISAHFLPGNIDEYDQSAVWQLLTTVFLRCMRTDDKWAADGVEQLIVYAP
jgi:hypothetical protein